MTMTSAPRGKEIKVMFKGESAGKICLGQGERLVYALHTRSPRATNGSGGTL